VDSGSRGPVRAAASAGTLDALDAEGRRFRWTPPAIRHPLLALLAFWVDTPGSPPEVALVRLPLLGRTTLEVTTEPGAQVYISIGPERFGPVRADRRGRAEVAVEVPPGVRQAQVLASAQEQRSERAVALDVPEQHPVLALVSPQALPRREGGYLRVFRAEGAGAGLPPEADGARVEPLEEGLFRLVPTSGATQVEARIPTGAPGEVVRVSAPVVASPSVPPEHAALQVHLLAGGFFAGGASTGLALALGAAGRRASWPEGLVLEVEAGLRRADLTEQVPGLGPLRSRLLAVPLLLGARFTLLERGALGVHARGAVGLLPAFHRTRSDFQAGFDERTLATEAFAGLQGTWALGRVSALAEVRLAHAPVHTPRLDAQLGGLVTLVGLRVAP
jgi:hypothetical protein